MTWNNGSKTNDRKHMKMQGRYIEQNCGTTNQDQGQNQQDLMISWLNVTVTFNHKWWLTESIFKRNEICSHVLDVCNIPQLIHIAVHSSYFLCIIMIQQYMLIYAYSWHLLGIQTVSGCISSNMGALLRRIHIANIGFGVIALRHFMTVILFMGATASISSGASTSLFEFWISSRETP